MFRMKSNCNWHHIKSGVMKFAGSYAQAVPIARSIVQQIPQLTVFFVAQLYL